MAKTTGPHTPLLKSPIREPSVKITPLPGVTSTSTCVLGKGSAFVAGGQSRRVHRVGVNSPPEADGSLFKISRTNMALRQR
jgi:hypothetical protein